MKKGVKLDEDGGETVTVIVTVNNNLVFKRSATITQSPGPAVRRYTTDDGDVISHNRRLGYKELARKMIVK